MADPTPFAKFVPGFEFLQGLMKNAGAGLPAMGQWIAPTIDPEELDKRIEQLKTVHFWLEQNTRMIAASIQALEVQRMTLSTLKTMNLPMADLTEALKARAPVAAAPEASPEPAPAPTPAAKPRAPKPSPAPAAPGVVDPMQWWGALTKQFGELAAGAMKEMAQEPGTAAAAKAPSSATKKSTPRKKPAAKPATARKR